MLPKQSFDTSLSISRIDWSPFRCWPCLDVSSWPAHHRPSRVEKVPGDHLIYSVTVSLFRLGNHLDPWRGSWRLSWVEQSTDVVGELIIVDQSYFFSKMCHQGSLGIRPGCWPRSPDIRFSRLCFRDWSFTLMRGGQRIMLECWGNKPGEEGGEKERRSSSWFYRAGSGRFDSEKEIFRLCKIW